MGFHRRRAAVDFQIQPWRAVFASEVAITNASAPGR
jgi:hypothetical protein